MILQDTYEVKKADIIPVEVSVPGSKSITNRALLIAALANGKSVLKGVLFSDDSRHFLQALQDLGFVVEIDEPHAVVSIEGKGGRVPKTKASVDVGSAGTAARFLTAYLGLCEGEYHMNSSEQMKKRPMEELLQALQDLGAEVTYKEASGHFPFAIGNSGVNRHEVTIDVEKSSQFLSALLISSVLFQKEFRIHVKGHHGMAYVEMTVAMMKQFGVEVQRPASDTFVIAEHAAYQAREYQIEPDVSAASYFTRYARLSAFLQRSATYTGKAYREILLFYMCWNRWDAGQRKNRMESGCIRRRKDSWEGYLTFLHFQIRL